MNRCSFLKQTGVIAAALAIPTRKERGAETSRIYRQKHRRSLRQRQAMRRDVRVSRPQRQCRRVDALPG